MLVREPLIFPLQRTEVLLNGIPEAGDALTETIARHCLQILYGRTDKTDAGEYEEITYKDIMGLTQTIAKRICWKWLHRSLIPWQRRLRIRLRS